MSDIPPTRLHRLVVACATALCLPVLILVSLSFLYTQTAAPPQDAIEYASFVTYLNYRAGLERPGHTAFLTTTPSVIVIGTPQPFAVGIGAVGPAWGAPPGYDSYTLTNVLANEYNVVSSNPYLNQVHPCPPRWMIDPAATRTGWQRYNARITQVILSATPRPTPIPSGPIIPAQCRVELANALYPPTSTPTPTPVNTPGGLSGAATPTLQPTPQYWATYETQTRNWYIADLPVAWAQQQRDLGHDVTVQMNPILWDLDGTSPHWFAGHSNLTSTYSYWSKDEHLSIVQLMKEYVQDTITRYCNDTTFTYYYNPAGPSGDHIFNGTNMNGIVAVHEVLNEITNKDGTVRQIKPYEGNSPYSWAIINRLVYTNTDYAGGIGIFGFNNDSVWDRELFYLYNPEFVPPNQNLHDYKQFYVYLAMHFARQAVEEECTDFGDRTPLLSVNSHFRVDLEIEDTAGGPFDNRWARSTIDLLNNINVIARDNTNDPNYRLVDRIGIQAHLYIKPNMSPTPTAGSAPPDSDGSADGLRSILEFVASRDLEVSLTELDVEILRHPSLNDPREHFYLSEATPYFALQADLYEDAFSQCLYEGDGDWNPICKSVILWVPFDGDCSYRTILQPTTPANCAFTPTPTPTATTVVEVESTTTPTPINSPTPTPTPTITPVPTYNTHEGLYMAPQNAYYPKPAHQKLYTLLQKAPLPDPTPTMALGAYPPPPEVPTPIATADPYP